MIVSCRTECLNDTSAAFQLLRELKFDIVGINIISDENMADFKMTCFTIELHGGSSLDAIADEIMTLVLADIRFADLHRIAQTLKEGNSPKF